MLMMHNAKMLGAAMLADIAGGAYQLDDIDYATLGDVPGMTATGAGGIALTPGGSLKWFAPEQQRIVPGRGFLREIASSNKISGMNNVAPVTTAGWGLLASRPPGATLTVVDDMTALYNATDPVSGEYIFRALIDAGVMTGKVVRAYNPSATDNFTIPAGGGTGGATQHAYSAYVRCIAGAGYLTVFGGGGSTPEFSGAAWRRVGRNGTPDGNRQLNLVVRPQSEVYIILAQLEPGAQVTSPIALAGLPASRKAESLFFSNAALLSRPATIVVEFEFDRLDSVERRFFTLRNARGEEIAVYRATDNSLSCTQTDERWRPGIARCYGPGIARIALRTRARGRTVGMGGVLAHDEFAVPPLLLDRLMIGADATGALPLNGWIRSIEIHPDVANDEMEEMVAPPAGSIAFDFARYVSPNGNDANDGRTPATAWRTLARAASTDVNLAVPQRGQVFLERGGTWTETLLPINYCTYRPYGSGERPKVGMGQAWGVDENGAGAWRLESLWVTGATQRGINSYGGSGIWLERCEISYCGSSSDPNSIGVAMRGNIRTNAANPFPTNALAEDFGWRLCWVHNIAGYILQGGAGDDVYCEGIARRVIGEGNRHNLPVGRAADCIQVSRCGPLEVAVPTHVIIRNNTMDMSGAGSGSGKGGCVIIAGSALIEGNDIYGLNFCISFVTSDTVIRWNRCIHARYQDYSFGVGASGGTNLYDNGRIRRIEIYQNEIEDCNRGILLGGSGGVDPSTGRFVAPVKLDVLVWGNVMRNCEQGIRVDRPTSGRIYDNDNEQCEVPIYLHPLVDTPSGGVYADLKIAFNRAA